MGREEESKATMLQPHSDMNSTERGMTHHDDDHAEDDPSVIAGVWRFVRFLVPHIVLLCIFFAYLLLGALVFRKLERNESDVVKYREETQAAKNELLGLVTNMSARTSPTPPMIDFRANGGELQASASDVEPNSTTIDYEGMDKEVLDEKIEEIMNRMKRPHWKLGRMESMQAGRAWTFPSAMLFCMTTITTIGYGDVVPVTSWGRAFCIVYSIIGIPLSLLCLASIGNLLARLTLTICRFLHFKMYCGDGVRIGNCSKCVGSSKGKQRFQKSRQSSSRRGLTNADSAGVIMEEIGKPPKYTSKEDEARQADATRNEHGITNSGLNEFPTEHPYVRSVSIATERPTSHPHGVTSKQPSLDVPEPCECTHDQGVRRVDVLEEVPLFIVLLILITYILAGAAMMSSSEGWPFGTGLYFMFITVTTIGFGDVLPRNHYAMDRFLPCLFFTMFGLAVMSMSIALVQAKIIRAFKLISMKLKLC